MSNAQRWRSIWISDVHLGTRHAQVGALLEFLRRSRSDNLYVVGDLIEFDGLTHFNRLLERVGAGIYTWILDLNLWLNRLRRRRGLGYWSVSAYLKQRAKQAVQYVTRYEASMVRLAEARGVDGVICGHIHRAEIRDIGGLRYLNCGDWVESCTALVEDEHGPFSLIHFHETAVHDSRRGARPHDPGAGRARAPLPVGA